jgi:hypothetical protein
MPNRRGSGGGRGMGPGRGRGLGASGNCICLKCGYRVSKNLGKPCMEEKCPRCASALVREGGAHHQQSLKNQKKEV